MTAATVPIWIDDVDVYADVDQALLRGEFPEAFERPQVVEIEGEGWTDAEAAGLRREIEALAPRTVIVRSSRLEGWRPWTSLHESGIELRARHVPGTSAEPADDYAPASRLEIDLEGIPAAAWTRVMNALPAPASLPLPVHLLLDVDTAGIEALDALLDALGPRSPACVTVRLDGFRPEGADDFARLLSVLSAHDGPLRIACRSTYRMLRLHLYYRLPLLRLVLDGDRVVRPVPRSPLRLGTWPETPLPAVWEANRIGFWDRAEVRRRCEGCYRFGDLGRGPR